MNQEILKIAKEVTGKENPEEMLEATLISYLEQKIAGCKKRIKDLEEKYSMGFREFHKNLGQRVSLSWEHERDYLDWEEAITNLKYFEEAMDKLTAYAGKIY